jgi:hypothetical protein
MRNQTGMKRLAAVGVAAALAGVGMAAVEAGLVGQPALGDGGLVVGYWAVFVRWARAQS